MDRRSIAIALLALVAAPTLALAAGAVTYAPAILARVRPHVEKACGATFETPPVVRELSASEAEKLFGEDTRPELERRYPGVTAGQMRFLMKGAASSSVRSCVARYSVTGKAIILVRSGFDRQRQALGLDDAEEGGELLTAALAHECVHALDDQRFDLGKLFRESRDEEALRAVNAIAEGRAVYFGRMAVRGLINSTRIRDWLPGGDDPADAREWRLHLTYRLGLRFVERLVERGGIALADRAMREPPVLTHHVCQPDRWPDGGEPEGLTTRKRMLEKLAGAAAVHPLSELQLRVRYADRDGLDLADALLVGFRGGYQVVVGQSNLAILTFAEASQARDYATKSQAEAKVEWTSGSLHVTRAAGPDAPQVLAKFSEAMKVALR